MGNINSQKGFAMPLIIAIIALVIVVAGVGYYTTRKQPQATQPPASEKTLEDGTIVKPDGTIVKPDGTMEKKEGKTMTKKDEGVMMAKYTGTVLAGKSALLLDFTKADYDAAIKSGKLVILYFYANWCPICKVEFPQAQAAFNELTTDKTIGFRVNYKDSDTDADETNLARQFGVSYQHTKVLLKGSAIIGKYPDGWDKARYLKEIQVHL